MIKIGILGGGAIGKALKILLESNVGHVDIELIETKPTDDQLIKIKEMLNRSIEVEQSNWIRQPQRTGRNKSDRKSDRKNRWR